VSTITSTLLTPVLATTSSLQLSSSSSQFDRDSSEQIHYKNVVMGMYMPVSKLGPCRYIDGTRKQNHQCRRDNGLADAVRDAKKTALTHCEDQFKFDRWNCSIETKGKRNIFKKVRGFMGLMSSCLNFIFNHHNFPKLFLNKF
jgi:hypothetical protein